MKLNQLNDLLVVNIFQECAAFSRETNAVNLAQGVPEPILETKINQALINSLSSGWQYAHPGGLANLQSALSQEYAGEYKLSEILITSGCTESLYLVMAAARQLYGSKVAFLEPYYPYYMGLTKLLDMEAIPLSMCINEGTFSPDWDAIATTLVSGCKIFILNSPHNPSGWVITLEEAALLRSLIEKFGGLLIIDEAYRYYTYDNLDNQTANRAIQILYQDNPHVVLAGSASKLLSATGLRIGWLLARKPIMDLAYAVHLYTTYCHPTPLQQVTATLLAERDANWFNVIQVHYQNKRDLLLNALTAAGFKCGKVAGGHFILADYSAIRTDLSAQEFAWFYAQSKGVMPLPVTPFYRQETMPKQVRFSFSVNSTAIAAAIEKIK